MIRNTIFYTIKPYIPRQLQILLRRKLAFYKRKKYANVWPIDPRVTSPPANWKGWPSRKKFALLLSHDVDTQKGQKNCLRLAELEAKMGFRSCFNFVPEGYKNSNLLYKNLRRLGCHIGVHGLKHDGKLFRTRKIFIRRAEKINLYLKKWNSDTFTAPSMHHNSNWMHALNISTSVSTFDTDPFEPQPDAANTIFPFWVQDSESSQGYLELPYTLPQDHLLFIILKEADINIWKRKLAWIAEKGGLALLNTHPDYMNFDGSKLGREEYPIKYYFNFLEYIMQKYKGKYWDVLPKDIYRFWLKEMIKKH